MGESNEKADTDWLGLDCSSYDDLCLDISDDDDEMNQLEPDVCPTSPVLGTVFHRPGRGSKDLENSTPLSSSVSKTNAIKTPPGNAEAECAQRNMDRKVVTSELRTVKMQKPSMKRPGESLFSNQEKKSSVNGLDAGVRMSCHQGNRVLGSSGPNKLVCEDNVDTISLYAMDEDCSSLYQSKQSCPQNRKPFRSNKAKNVSSRKSITLRPHGRFPKPDLRNAIRKPSDSVQVSVLTECNQHLNENTVGNTVRAAEVFCKAYTDHVFQKGNKEIGILARRLTGMLMRNDELKHLYRVVRLSITMNIHLDEDLICTFVRSLCFKKEYGKVNIILTQIRDAPMEFGDCVRNLVVKYLDMPPESQRMTQSNSNICSRVVMQTQENLRHRRFSNNDRLPGQSDTKKIGVLDAVSAGPTGLNWKKDPLFIEIRDINDPKGNRIARLNQECNSQNNMQVAVQNGIVREYGETIDFSKLGKCVAELLEAIGGLPVSTSLFSAFAELLVSTARPELLVANFGEKLGDFDTFICAAINNADNKERIKARLSWICVEMGKQLPPKTAYQFSCYIQRAGLQHVPPITDSPSKQSCRKARFFSVDTIVNNCLQFNDLDLALLVVHQYFSGTKNDFGPFLSPLICALLSKVAEVAYASKRYMDAAKCCTLFPAGFGDGSEATLMEDILHGILTDHECPNPKSEENVCNSMVDQMLIRGLSTEVRRIIAKAFSAKVVPVFKFLEAKGIYRKPRIAHYPHLIVIPYVLCVQEMAMVIQRHLTELSEFLVEMGERIRMDIPLRIVLSKEIGSLKPFSPLAAHCKYKGSLTRLLETLDRIVTPSLKRQSQHFQPMTNEFLINIDIVSVRSWMLANTNYREGHMK